jgi:hypothetical protein
VELKPDLKERARQLIEASNQSLVTRVFPLCFEYFGSKKNFKWRRAEDHSSKPKKILRSAFIRANPWSAFAVVLAFASEIGRGFSLGNQRPIKSRGFSHRDKSLADRKREGTQATPARPNQLRVTRVSPPLFRIFWDLKNSPGGQPEDETNSQIRVHPRSGPGAPGPLPLGTGESAGRIFRGAKKKAPRMRGQSALVLSGKESLVRARSAWLASRETFRKKVWGATSTPHTPSDSPGRDLLVRHRRCAVRGQGTLLRVRIACIHRCQAIVQ